MKPFDGLHIFERAGTILAVNHSEESEGSRTDKAKPRVIVGRLPAVTGGRPTAQRWSRRGKPRLRAETQQFGSPDEQVFWQAAKGRHYGVQARILNNWDGRATEVGVRGPGPRGFIQKVTLFFHL